MKKWFLILPVAFLAIVILGGQQPRKPDRLCTAAYEMQESTGGRVRAAEAAKLVCDNAAAREGVQGLVRKRYGD